MMTGNKNTAARMMTHCWHGLFSITLPVCFLVILLLKVMIPVGDKYRDFSVRSGVTYLRC